MRKILAIIFITAIICIGGTTSFFLWLRAPNLSSAVQLIARLPYADFAILNRFSSIDNLEGFVVKSSQNQQQTVIYADNQGRYLILGNLIGKNGENITAKDYQNYVEPQSATLAFSHLAGVTFIQQGESNAPHQAYIVFDPNCIFCSRLFKVLKPYVTNDELAIRWIPVAFLKPSSQGRVYAMLSSINPLSMLEQNEKQFNEQNEEGGVLPLASTLKVITDQLENNMAFLTESQIKAVPLILYKTTNGSTQLKSGYIDSSKIKQLIQNFTPIF